MDNATNARPVPAQPSLFATIRPVVVLVAICMVAGTLLGAVQTVTAPVAAANAEARAQATYAALVPEAASFEPVACEVEGCTAALEARDASGATVAHVIVAEAKGYGGPVPLAVAFDADGTVIKAIVMPNDETPGLGTKVENEAYIGQFAGLEAEPADDKAIDLISGATISSKATLAAFNTAVEAYEEVR